MSSRRWVDTSVRILLSLGLSYCIYVVSICAVAEWYFRLPVPEGIRKAIGLNSRNPVYHAALARVLERSTGGADLAEVIRLHEEATKLKPKRARYWAELGGSYELAGRLKEAQHAYEKAQQLFPNSPEINWQLGNFYIRQDEPYKALRAFKKVLLGDSSLREPVFELAWRAQVSPESIRNTLLPSDTSVLFEYLNFLSRRGHLDEAHQIWNEILNTGHPFNPKDVFSYLNALLQSKRIGEAQSAWKIMAQLNPMLMRQGPLGSGIVTNGDFEGEILNGGLGWRIRPVEGVVVSIDSLTFFDGTRSLRIQFDGRYNVNYYHITQYVPVEQNKLYHFMGYMRTKDITTDQGLRFEIRDAYDPSRLFLSTENLTGTNHWVPQQLEFQAGPETRLLLIRVRRLASHKFDNKIRGTVWVDRISLNSAD